MKNMPTLEQTLRYIAELEKDLGARKVVGQKKCGQHDEAVYKQYLDYYEFQGHETVIDYEDIRKPDLEKQEDSRQKLQCIYESCELQSGKYMARKVLGIGGDEAEDIKWIGELNERFGATRTETRTIGGLETVSEWSYKVDHHERKWVERQETYTFVDAEQRFNALKDTGELYFLTKSSLARDLLKRVKDSNRQELLTWDNQCQVYEDVDDEGREVNTGFVKKMRKQAKTALRYESKKFKDWLNKLLDKIII